MAIGAVPAFLFFSAFYGAVHVRESRGGTWGIANTILIGVLLSVAYLRTRALWLPWGIHFGMERSSWLFLGLPMSGFRYFNLIRYTVAFGPE